MSNIELKTKLHHKCVELVNIKIEQAKNELSMLKEAIEDESKNSSADEQDAGRAMLHIEQEKVTAIFDEAVKLNDVLKKLDIQPFQKQFKVEVWLLQTKFEKL